MKRNGLLQAIVLAGILAVGFQIVWALAGGWCLGVTAQFTGPIKKDQLMFLPDGTPRVVRTDGIFEKQYLDLEGQIVAPPEKVDANYMGMPLSILPEPGGPPSTSAPLSWDQRILSFTDGGSPPVHWFFITDGCPSPSAYFVGYNCKTRSCIGYMGTAGIRKEPLPPEEWIPVQGSSLGLAADVVSTQPDWGISLDSVDQPGMQLPASYFSVFILGRAGKLYHVDLQERTVQVALEEKGLCAIGQLPGVPDLSRLRLPRLAARTDDAVVVLDAQGGILQRYRIPGNLRDMRINFATTTAEEALMQVSVPTGTPMEFDHQIYWVARGGSIRKASVVLKQLAESEALHRFAWAVLPSPILLGIFVEGLKQQELLESGRSGIYRQPLIQSLRDYAPSFLFAQLLAIAFAFSCYRRQVRFGARGINRVVWPLFVLVFGFPGWIGYRFGRTWPVQAACDSCGTTAPQDREDCVAYASTFSRPALTGTEVFA
ncbi:MAG TPA: hypothetical protein VK395_31735 [Gemmataceae bacterium]|nr:hypothetical protein [Gemmataceae bacterium]